MKEENNKGLKPKQYTHIDYEAILIYAMKNRISIEEALAMNGLDIARSTVVRNIREMKKETITSIIDLYEKQYVPNSQKKILPEKLQETIDELQERDIVMKPELEDLYTKLSFMKELVDRCNGNKAEAARIISSGNTILGNVRISTQGLAKDLKKYEIVAEEMKKQKIEGREEK